MNDGITIGGHESPPERGPYATAIAELVRGGERWADVCELDRERLACLYAAEHCTDTLLGKDDEREIWSAVASCVMETHNCRNIGRVSHAGMCHARDRVTAVGAVLFERLIWRAMDQAEQIVKRHYNDAYDAAHGDPADDTERRLDAAARNREAASEVGR